MSTRIHQKIPLPPPFGSISESITRVPEARDAISRNKGGMLLYFLGGEAMLAINGGKPALVREGSIVIVPGPSSRTYTATTKSSVPLHSYGIGFSHGRPKSPSAQQTELLDIIDSAFSKPAILTGDNVSIRQRLLVLRHELDSKEPGSLTLVYGAVLNLCIETARLVIDRLEWKKSPPGRRKGRSLINGSLEYMLRNLKENPSIESIAWTMKVSTEHLCRTFRYEMGITPRSALRNLQIDEAKALIINSPLEIYRIAEKTGFSSVTAFGRFFKNAVGMTPTEYRASNIGDFVRSPVFHESKTSD